MNENPIMLDRRLFLTAAATIAGGAMTSAFGSSAGVDIDSAMSDENKGIPGLAKNNEYPGMFQYFPEVYWPNLLFHNALATGAAVGDLHDAAWAARELLLAGKSDTDPEFKTALFDGFTSVGKRLENLIEQDLNRGRKFSAGAKLLRATTVYQWLDFLNDDFHDPRKLEIFEKSRSSFKKALSCAGPPHDVAEFVEIPFEKDQLDGLFVPATQAAGPSPVVIHVNGSHSTMDWPYLLGLVNMLACRGIASLTFDHPGSGTARFHKGMHFRHDSETFVKAAIDYLVGREEIDQHRIGVCGASLGGYYAPRAAVFEKRIKAVMCLGALYEWPVELVFGDNPSKSFGQESEDNLGSYRLTFNAKDNRELLFKVKQFTLDGIIDRLSVPLFVVHGENDVQVPLDHAVRTVNGAVNSPKADLLVIGPEEGGDQHCNIDNPGTALHALADWAAEIFKTPTGR